MLIKVAYFKRSCHPTVFRPPVEESAGFPLLRRFPRFRATVPPVALVFVIEEVQSAAVLTFRTPEPVSGSEL